ncbi:MAG: DUF1549 and DUF1553 domain-containing protein [Planctomycetota bacterium]
MFAFQRTFWLSSPTSFSARFAGHGRRVLAPPSSLRLALSCSLLLAISGSSWCIGSRATATEPPPVSKPATTPEPATSAEPAARRAAMVALIDAELAQGWREQGTQPAKRADDAEFLRRVSLDLTGIIPRLSEAREFLEDPRADKRTRKIDQLLAAPRHATHQANLWRQILLPNGFDAEQIGSAAGVQNWLRDQFADGVRYDRLVSDFLVATTGNEAGPALFYTSLETKPEKLAAATARIFLGLQIECAECHHHPFDAWKQEQFWGYAAFFARVRQPAGRGAMRAIRLEDVEQGEVSLPGTQRTIAPAFPDGSRPVDESIGTRREQLAIWMASRDNPYLAKAAVNRVWAQLFGRGLVEPVDDLSTRNLPSHPELFNSLTAYFVESGFDLVELQRTLAATEGYQLSSHWESKESPPLEQFARSTPRPLTGDQLYDSLVRLIGLPATPSAPGALPLLDERRRAFLSRWPAPGRAAHEYQAGVLQALQLMNGSDANLLTTPSVSSLLTGLNSPLFSDQQRVESLFLATLTRLPNDDESRQFSRHLEQATDKSTALGDLLWALVNSAEFGFNH